MSALKVISPVTVVDAPLLRIDEYFGNVASKDSTISACIATVTGATEEAYQTPEFDEYVIVLEVSVDIIHKDTTNTVKAGEGVFLAKNTRVKWKWNGPCKYIPICLPAFNPHNCHREHEDGTAKSDQAMDHLHKLHADAKKEQNNSMSVGKNFLTGAAIGVIVGSALAFFLKKRE